MAKKGKNTYIPPIIIDEMEDIKRERGLVRNSDAFTELTKYARVGRETERLMKNPFRLMRRS